MTTVAILGAIYIFFVKPALDTTEKISGEVNQNIQQAQDQSRQASADAALNSATSRAESYATSLASSWPKASAEVKRCVSSAGGDVDGLEKCADLGQEIAHTVQSDRNFALSYADSLKAQGKSAEAKRVTDCVEQAGSESDRCSTAATSLTSCYSADRARQSVRSGPVRLQSRLTCLAPGPSSIRSSRS